MARIRAYKDYYSPLMKTIYRVRSSGGDFATTEVIDTFTGEMEERVIRRDGDMADDSIMIRASYFDRASKAYKVYMAAIEAIEAEIKNKYSNKINKN